MHDAGLVRMTETTLQRQEAPVVAQRTRNGANQRETAPRESGSIGDVGDSQEATASDVARRGAAGHTKAGEGDRTLDIQLGKLTKSPVSSLSVAKRSAGESAQNQNDPHLAMIVTAWPALSDAVKAGIVAMVVASTEKNE